MPLATGKRHVSFSEIKDWKECSYRHKLKHIDKLGIFEDSVHTVFGKSLHAVCEEYIKTRIIKPEIFLAELKKGWKKYDFPDLDIWMERGNKAMAALPDWMEIAFPGWVGIEAEETLMEEIPFRHGNVKFKGYIDAIVKCGNYYWLIDWKTAGSGWHTAKKDDPLIQLQLVYYNLFWAQKHNIPHDRIKAAFVLLNRDEDAEERCEIVTINVTNDSRDNGITILNNMVSSVKQQRAFKAWKRPEGEWQGNCMFCEFNGTKHCPKV